MSIRQNHPFLAIRFYRHSGSIPHCFFFLQVKLPLFTAPPCRKRPPKKGVGALSRT
jgi:hypothetical protein